MLRPGATGKDLVELLDGKAERTLTLHWRSGRRSAPRWALDALHAKLRARHAQDLAIVELALSAPERPGKQAGARNLAAYLAKRNR